MTYLVAQTVMRLPTVRETQVRSLGREDLLKKGMATHSNILPPPQKKGAPRNNSKDDPKSWKLNGDTDK